MHNRGLFAGSTRSGVGRRASVAAEQDLSHVHSTRAPMRILVLAAATCVAAAFASIASADQAPLALNEAQRLAIERSPEVAAHDEAGAAAHGMALAVARLPELTLQLGVDYLPLGKPLTSGEEREAAVARYLGEADRAAERKTASVVDIARETALAWLDCHYVEQMSRIATNQLEFGRAELEGAERMYWAGRLSQAEFYAARSMLVMFEDKSSELEHEGRAARIALERWVGKAAVAPLAALPNIDRIRLKSAALEGDLARAPEVALLAKEADLAASDLQVAKASGRSAPEIAAALARRDEARAARDEKLRADVAQMRILIDRWQHARDRRDRYARELVPLARERTLATLVAYRGGKASLVEVLAARRTEADAQLQSVEMERASARMWARLEFAVPETIPAPARSSSQEGAQ
jgi:outer membrane protein TolC